MDLFGGGILLMKRLDNFGRRRGGEAGAVLEGGEGVGTRLPHPLNRLRYRDELFHRLVADVFHPLSNVRVSCPTYADSPASGVMHSFNET